MSTMNGLEMENKNDKQLEERMSWSFSKWRDSKDRLDRMIWFIGSLSPHNYWRGWEALQGFIQAEVKAERKRVNKYKLIVSLEALLLVIAVGIVLGLSVGLDVFAVRLGFLGLGLSLLGPGIMMLDE